VLLGARLETREVKDAASSLAQAISETTERIALEELTDGLAALLAREELPVTRGRLTSAAVTTAVAPSSPTATLAAPAPLLALPSPPPLPAQVLVELLGDPFSVGVARRLVLDQLQRHYHRPFADQWDFVRFATERKLPLDLASPARRPDPTAASAPPVAGPR
jgi:hypothetical protein